LRKAALIIAGILISSVALAGYNYGELSERLAFVGEDTRVLTIASGRPEMPERAPAVASVVTREEMEERGYRTLGELLRDVPGFFTYRREANSVLFARGVPSGALFLFDGVPFTSDITKSLYPLDEEMSLAYLKRAEVVRGPGSVLWGPDAFEGIVNVVPMKGRDVNGIRAEAKGEGPKRGREFSILAGKYRDGYDGMVFARGYYQKDHSSKYTQEFYEVVSKLSYKDAASLTLRVSNFHRPRELRFEGIKWKAREDRLSYLLKLELCKKLSHTSLKAKAYVLRWNFKDTQERFAWEYSDSVYYGELSVSRDLFNNRGLLVLGASIRRNLLKNAPVKIKSFIPDYINSKTLKPLVEKRDFDTTLRSLFAQYLHHWEDFEFWLGARYDKHTDYSSSFSYNLGVGWYPKKQFVAKLMYGVAYRTPYAAQFLRKGSLNPERSETLNLSLSYKIGWLRTALSAFVSRIKEHVGEDPYGGFSHPSTQYIDGLEASLSFHPASWISLWGTATALHHHGEREHYRVLDYIIITPEGARYYYSNYERDFFFGPSFFASLGATVQPTKKLTVSITLRYNSPFDLYSIRLQRPIRSDAAWLADLNASYRLSRRAKLTLKVENLFSERKDVPGEYMETKTRPTRAFFGINVSF